MKKLLKARAVQGALAAVLAAYLRLVYATSRWTIEGGDTVRAAQESDEGVIVFFWHSRIPLSGRAWRNSRSPKLIRGLVSHSADGEFITGVMNRIGFPCVRGSRADERSSGNKGGGQALREMVRHLKAGDAQAVTPDGPKGPARLMSEGGPTLARLSGAKVLFLGMAHRPSVVAGSWDRTVLPLPFGRGAIVWQGPVRLERGADLARTAADWTARLNAATDRAEALLA